jgi:diguanylate cyclase (GGDEF)-like protein
MRTPLKLKYALLIFAALLVGLSALTVMLYNQGRGLAREMTELGTHTLQDAARAQQLERASLLSDFLAPTLVAPVYYSDFDGVRKLIETALKQPDVAYVLVYDQSGKLLHDGSLLTERFGQPMQDPGAAAAVAARERTSQTLDGVIEVVTPLRIGAEQIGGVRLGISMGPVKELAERNRVTLENASASNLTGRTLRALPWLLLMMVIAALLSLLVTRGLVAPILSLRNYAQRLQAGDYNARTKSTRNDEIGDLMRSFDGMADAVSRQHNEIAQLAFSDPLTGMPNRNRAKALIQAHLEMDVEKQHPCALLLLDLDDFKRINDSLGHDAGDRVLLELSKRLSECVTDAQRGAEVPHRMEVARFGGDEFLLLVFGPDARKCAHSLGERLLAISEHPFVLGDRQLFAGMSIGVAVYPEDGASVDLLLKNADVAMYQAKVSGKNMVRFFAAQMVEEVSHRLNLDGELRYAIKRGELSLQYQPLIRLRDQVLIGAEALLRWQHPTYGSVPPSIFVPLAEDTDLISTLGEWAIIEAARQTKLWAGHIAPDFYVSVNVSVRQLRRQDVPAIVQRALLDCDLAPQHFSLEITESSLFESSSNAGEALERLRAMGVKLWLDDFGTGFSGLSQLRRMPVHGVKIDRSFVTDMAHDPEDLAITNAIIAMAQSLGMKVTAEGIETQEQLNLLTQRGCDTGQGFLFNRPLSVDAFTALLEKSAG